MSWTLCTLSEALLKAGSGKSTTLSANLTELGKLSDEAEGSFCGQTRRDWVTLSSATKTIYKGIIADAVSDMIAMKIINYDMSGYTSRMEAGTMLDVMKDNSSIIIAAIKDDKIKAEMIN